MEPLVVLVILLAALLHATWHALVKSSGDRIVALAGMNLVSGAVALAFIPFVAIPRPTALAVIAGSVFLHVGYKIGLAGLYHRADLGQAYPLARGVTPIFATLLGFLVLAETPGWPVLLGMALISLGVLLLAREKAERRLGPGTLAIAALTGLAVAAYSAVDAWGVRINGDWIGFTAWLIVADTATFLAYAFLARGRAVLGAWREGIGRMLISGVLGIGSFGAFLWALSTAPVAGVTALRETSVIFAALIGAVVLGERATPIRHLATLLVAAGVITMALGR